MKKEEILKKIKRAQEELNCFVTINEELPESDQYIAIKDNFSTKGILSTASSNTLKDYIPYFDATVIEKLNEKGYVSVGKTVMDELGMGASGTTGHTGAVKNPWNTKHLTAGSSAGSAAAVAAGVVPYAIGSDTGDSVRKPAAYCGIVGFKPTYGLISRYGLFAFASSLDHVGVFARNVADIAKVTNDIKGIDERDMTSFDSSHIDLMANLEVPVKGKKICYIKELCDINEYAVKTDNLKETIKIFNETLDNIKKLGIEVQEVSINKDLLNAIYPVYLSISCAEATSNCANLTGIIFGPRGEGQTVEQQMIDHRTKGFSPLIKRRFVIGSYVLQKENQKKYFLNAQRVRRLIVDQINDLFEKYDGLILPASSRPAPSFDDGEVLNNPHYQIIENHMGLGNFGGFPSITIPNGFINDLPIGINITGKIMDDANILNIAHAIEGTMPYKNQIAKGWE